MDGVGELFDFDPELRRTLVGEDFLGVFLTVPSFSLTFGFLYADKCLIEKFNASCSIGGDDGKSLVVIC